MGTRTSDSCRARDLSALAALWWAWPASHRVAREGAGQARLVAVSQNNRRLLRSIVHAQRAPPFAAPGLEAPKARALPGYATPRKVLAAETVQDEEPRRMSAAPSSHGRGRCRPRFGSRGDAPTDLRDVASLTDQASREGGPTTPFAAVVLFP